MRDGGGGGKSRNKGQGEKKGGNGITHLTRNLVCSQVIYTKRLSERKLCQNKFNSKSWFFLQQTEHKWLLPNNFIPYPSLDNKLRRRLAPFYDKLQDRKWINLALEFLNSIKPQVRNMFILGISRQFHSQETRYRQMLTVLYVKTIYCTFYKQNKQKK